MNRKLFLRSIVNTFSHTFAVTIRFTVRDTRTLACVGKEEGRRGESGKEDGCEIEARPWFGKRSSDIRDIRVCPLVADEIRRLVAHDLRKVNELWFPR